MKILRSWLADYIDTDLNNEQLSEKLSFSGTLVEAVEAIIDDRLVIGYIKDIKAHPNADRLKIVTVYNGSEDLQIVCGATNIEVGQKVPLAQIGTILPEIEIKKAEIRGVESFGMLCSDRELGLSEEHTGIKILPEDYVPGEKLSKYLNSDAVLELEITPNRGDCLSHLGIAREIASIENKKLKITNEQLKSDRSIQEIKLEVKNPELCPQYFAIVISGIKVEDSPNWLKNRLLAIGQKSINNIVDITNYIMFDCGQPLHAFDLCKIDNRTIVIRSAHSAEKIKTLDGSERELTQDMLVVADNNKPIVITFDTKSKRQ